MKNITNHQSIVLIFFLSLLAACQPDKAEKEQEIPPDSYTETAISDRWVYLTEAQMEAIGIELGHIEKKDLAQTIKVNGILKVPNQNKAFATPLFNGVVRTLEVEAGSFVREGQIVATVFNPELTRMQQQLRQTSIEIDLAATEVRRQQGLVEGNASPLKNLQQAEAELEILRSKKESLARQLENLGVTEKDHSSDIPVRAPLSGTVSKVAAQIGSNVDLGSPIAEIVNNSRLHLDLFIYEKDLPKIKVNQKIHFTLTNNPLREYDATIFSIGASFEDDSKAIRVHASIRGDKSGLIDGMNITALVSLDDALVSAVPVSALVNDQGTDFLFVRRDQKPGEALVSRSGGAIGGAAVSSSREETGKTYLFEKIPVAKGITAVGYSEITPLTGLSPEAEIIVKGAFFAFAKMTNTEDHAH